MTLIVDEWMISQQGMNFKVFTRFVEDFSLAPVDHDYVTLGPDKNTSKGAKTLFLFFNTFQG